MRHIVKSLLFGAVAALVCGACSRPTEAADASPYPSTTIACDENAAVALATGGLLNNMWGRASAGPGPWRQCLQSRVRDGHTEFGWSWNWPRRDGLYAYPELLVGRSPWRQLPSNDPRFPRRIADTRSMAVDYEVESEFEGKKNLAAEFWLTDTDGLGGSPSARDIKAELMIWSDYSSGMVSGKDQPVASVTIDGMPWLLYVHRDWGADVGVAGAKWTFLVYRAMKPSPTAHYDARKFFQDAIDRGFVEPEDFIATLELGNEITSGNGVTWIKTFKVDIQ